MEQPMGQREHPEQIPQEDGPQSKTGSVVSEQGGIEGQRKEVNVESYSEVAAVGQILKDLEFPADKNRIIECVRQSSNERKDAILNKLQSLEEKEYKNVSDVTTAAGLVY